MLNTLKSARARIVGFLDWVAIYPLVFDKRGREQIVRYIFNKAKDHPEIAEEFQRLAARIAAEEALANAMKTAHGPRDPKTDDPAEAAAPFFPGQEDGEEPEPEAPASARPKIRLDVIS